MKAYVSISSGIVIGQGDDAHLVFARSAVDERTWEPAGLPHLVSHIRDWEEIDWRENTAELENVARRYRTARLTSLCMVLLEGVSKELEREILEHLEELHKVGASGEESLSRLLAAPLKEPQRAQRLARTALGLNCSATANLFNELTGLQPLLHRLASAWLQVPATNFLALERSQGELWSLLAENQLRRKLLESHSQSDFKQHWHSLVFRESRPSARSAIVALGHHLAEQLFPAEVALREQLMDEAEEAAGDEHGHSARATSSQVSSDVKYSRALKQINSIGKAVAVGDDIKARRFLRDLIESQSGEDVQYAVKSLCNIANRCRAMFRSDFERQCLTEALKLQPHDSWTLIQWGDHLKRTGQFDDAIASYHEAASHGDPVVATTAIADVWRQRGDYRKALELYHSVLGWENSQLIRMATADIFRFQGRFEDAIHEYNDILERWPMQARAKAGLAEISKRRGDLKEALRLYDEILVMPMDDDLAWLIYRSARCHVLKLDGQLNEAFEAADQLVQDAPFYMEARLQRASIMALLGKAQDVLMDIPALTPHAFGEWRQSYLRGLLLFKLSRFKEARTLLLEQLNSWMTRGESLCQLAAAYAYLQMDDTNVGKAKGHLVLVNNLDDVHAEHLRLVLELHVATLQRDTARVSEIRAKLATPAQMDPAIKNAVTALGQKNYKKVLAIELQMLLNAA
jgi:tetratricopeptide (TPR) repeat protein